MTARGFGFVVLATAALAGCGERTRLVIGDGASAAGGGGGAGGVAGAPPGGRGGSTSGARPAGCDRLGIRSVEDAETKLVVPRCGSGPPAQICHNGVFPPRMNLPGMIRAALVDRRGTLSCMNDFYVNRANPERSIVLSTVRATGTVKDFEASCPGAAPLAPGMKGTAGRMPPSYDPSRPNPPLSPDELPCLVWYVYEIAK